MAYTGWNARKDQNPTLYLPVAVPGSGKSWKAQSLVLDGSIEETAIVSPDEYRERLTDNRADQECNGIVFNIVDKIVNYRMRRHLDIYLDATNLTAKPRTELLTAALEYEYDVVVLQWDLEEEEIRERNRNRKYAVPEDAMDRMFARLKNGVDLTDFPNVRVEIVK